MTSKTVPPVRIAVDIGGTFTDLQILDARIGSHHQPEDADDAGGPVASG